MTPEEHSFSGGRGRRFCERISVYSRPHLPVLLSTDLLQWAEENEKLGSLRRVVQSPKLLGRYRNLHGETVRFFPACFRAVGPTYWVPVCSLSSFSLQPVKKKHRARMIEYFIDVARECFNIGNFNSLMAIICEYFCENTGFMGLLKCIHWKISFQRNSVLKKTKNKKGRRKEKEVFFFFFLKTVFF